MSHTMSKRVAIYARVSTDGQSVENQLRELKRWQRGMTGNRWRVCGRGISDAKSREQRPQFNAILNGVVRKEFDLVAA